MKIWSAILLISLAAKVHSQNYTITDTIFLDEDWNETDDRSDAEYYRGTWLNPEDSTILVHDFYLETFTIQMIGVYKRKVKPNNQIGEFKYFYKNGNLRAVYNYDQGKMHGRSDLYYENGNIEVSRKFDHGRLTDTLIFYYENGKPRESRCINKEFDGENPAEAEKEYRLISYWNSQGEELVKNGTGTKIEYYNSGVKRQSIEYTDGFPNGDWIQYTDKKKIISKMTFKNGKFISGIMYPKKTKDIFASLYREPRFPGGVKALDEFVERNAGKCKEAMQENVTLMLRISENGEAEFEQILSGNVSHCQYDELEELVRKMPKWTPAVRYGRYVESTYVIRVNYQ